MRPLSLTVAGAAAACLFIPPAAAQDLPEQSATPSQHEEEGDSLLPQEGAGLIGLEGGFRYAFPSSFAKGFTVTSHSGGPAAMLPFLYKVDRSWAVQIEIGYGTDQFSLQGDSATGSGIIRLQTVTVQIGAQWTPDLGLRRLEPVFGMGLGYYLSTLGTANWAQGPTQPETNTTGIFVSAGLRYAVTSRFGLTLEDRYALATTGAGNLGSVSVGGNTAALGVYVVWKE